MSRTANFTRYTDNGFTDKDQYELARLFKRLDDRKCMVLLSNSYTSLVKELVYDFENIKKVNTLRAINSNALRRMGHTELLISNYLM